MNSYRVSRRARRDIVALWNRIAAQNEAAADRLIDHLVRHFRLLADVPYAGRFRGDLRDGYRSFPVGEYLIFYRVEDPGIQIMHIVHGRRNFERYPF